MIQLMQKSQTYICANTKYTPMQIYGKFLAQTVNSGYFWEESFRWWDNVLKRNIWYIKYIKTNLNI